MLGSRADAEDIVQEAYVRWHQTEADTVRNAEAWLVTTATRLAIDRLRALKVEREAYTGPWLPEPLIAPEPPDREAIKYLMDRVMGKAVQPVSLVDEVRRLAVAEGLTDEEAEAAIAEAERIMQAKVDVRG